MISLDLKKTLPWILLLIFLAVLNETVFNVSTPAIAAEFALSPTGVSWVVTAFIVFFGIGSVVYGRLSDLFSLRLLITVGIVIYATGSLIGFAFQAWYPMIIVARVLQGIGGSAIPALIMVIVARYFAPEVRGTLFGTIGSVISVAAGFGPVVGGFVAGVIHWTWLFLIPLLTLVGLVFLRGHLPREARKEGSVDVLGAALMVIGVGSLVVWLTYPEWPWLATGLVFSALFGVRLATARAPFVDPGLFRVAPYRAGVLTSLFLFIVLFSLFFVLPLMLHRLNGLDSTAIGLVLFPGAISGVFTGPWAGRLADTRGNRFVMVVGLILLALGLTGVALVLGQTPYLVSALLVVFFVGFTFFNTGLINAVSQSLPPHEVGVGMGLFNMVSFLSGAIGTAVAARILDLKLVNDTVFVLILTAGAVAAALAYLVSQRSQRVETPPVQE